jgi:MoaA/NifB/PqqE/SkfB family radical SAM enzyme
MKYDIEADWQLLDTCNYRCTYCFLGPDVLGSKLRSFAEPGRWSDAFDDTGLTWLLHLTGGEPGAYPGFVELCAALTKRHFISLNSNLTHPSMTRFAHTIDPSRVSFINAGLHLDERDRRAGHDIFLQNLSALDAAGFTALVSLVATPEVLGRFPEAIARLQPVGLFPIPKLLRGPFEGRHYPEGYTAQERRLFATYAAQARSAYAARLAQRNEPPTIDMLNDDRFTRGLPDYVGLMCDAGRRFVQIVPNGDIFRCGARDFLGNVLEGSFARRESASPCASGHCYYFCNKYSHPAGTVARFGRTARTIRRYAAAGLHRMAGAKSAS